MATTFEGGSPVSSASNPFSKAAGLEPEDILPSLEPEAHERAVLSDLDAYGSSPVTSDAAAQRPLNPSTIGGIDTNE